MAGIYEHHIFVCVNERDPSDSRGCCSARGSEEVLEAFRKEIQNRGLKGKVRANKSGCMDQCAKGPVVVIYPEAVWYMNVKPADVKRIVDEMLRR
jgi:(2Fe-2S) ferredoxin